MGVNIYECQCLERGSRFSVLSKGDSGRGSRDHEKLMGVVEDRKKQVLRFAQDDKGWEGIG
jgi:hypothetical protein